MTRLSNCRVIALESNSNIVTQVNIPYLAVLCHMQLLLL